jgi:hypothetical protein
MSDDRLATRVVGAAVWLAAAVTIAGAWADGTIPPPAASADRVVDLAFRDLYRHPVGSLGLEPSATLLRLGGQRVRMVGYIVDSEEPVPGLIMLAPLPVHLAEADDGPADDLPGSTVFVHLPAAYASRIPRYQPGAWQVVGTLELGGREEPNGRISYVRLLADGPLEDGR